MPRKPPAITDNDAFLAALKQIREEQPDPEGAEAEEREETSTPELERLPIFRIPLDRLVPDPKQPRQSFDDDALQVLGQSLREHGQLQPILVRPAQGPGRQGQYEIIAGERRFRAARLAGLETLECRVVEFELLKTAVVQLVENIHREDLNEIDKAQALQRLKTMTDQTWEEIAQLVQLSESYVKKLVGLLKLAEPVQQLIESGQLSASQGDALQRYPGQLQIAKAQEAVQLGLTATAIRQAAQRELPPARRGRKPLDPGPAIAPNWLTEIEKGEPPASPSSQLFVETPVDLTLLQAVGEVIAESDLPPGPEPRSIKDLRTDGEYVGQELGAVNWRLLQLREYSQYLNSWLQDPRVKSRQPDPEMLQVTIRSVYELLETLRRYKKGNL